MCTKAGARVKGNAGDTCTTISQCRINRNTDAEKLCWCGSGREACGEKHWCYNEEKTEFLRNNKQKGQCSAKPEPCTDAKHSDCLCNDKNRQGTWCRQKDNEVCASSDAAFAYAAMKDDSKCKPFPCDAPGKWYNPFGESGLSTKKCSCGEKTCPKGVFCYNDLFEQVDGSQGSHCGGDYCSQDKVLDNCICSGEKCLHGKVCIETDSQKKKTQIKGAGKTLSFQ